MRASMDAAHEVGVTGTPAWLLDGKLLIPGVQDQVDDRAMGHPDDRPVGLRLRERPSSPPLLRRSLLRRSLLRRRLLGRGLLHRRLLRRGLLHRQVVRLLGLLRLLGPLGFAGLSASRPPLRSLLRGRGLLRQPPSSPSPSSRRPSASPPSWPARRALPRSARDHRAATPGMREVDAPAGGSTMDDER